MEMSFGENLLVCIIVGLVLIGILAIINLLGLGLMRLRDRETNRKRLYVIRREWP